MWSRLNREVGKKSWIPQLWSDPPAGGEGPIF